MDSFDALYYPYADVRSSSTLLEACLFFDHVYALEPNFFRAPAVRDQFDVPHSNDLNPLIEAGVIQPLGPTLLGFTSSGASPLIDEDNLEFVKSSIGQDLADAELPSSLAGREPQSWRIPTGQQLYWNGLGLLLGRPETRISILAKRVDYYRKYIRSIGYDVEVKGPPEQRWRGSDELQVDVPYLEAESLIITITLLAAAELGLSPVTDNPSHDAFMRRKLSRLYADPSLRATVGPMVPLVSEQDIGLHTLRIHVPRLSISSANAVVLLREKCADSLGRFRSHFRRLGLEMSARPWTLEFQEEIRRMIVVDIDPALDDLKAQLKEESRSLGIRLLAEMPQAAPLPLIATLAAGVPPAVGLAAGSGAAALSGLATFLASRRALRRNGLYFLLEAERHLQ